MLTDIAFDIFFSIPTCCRSVKRLNCTVAILLVFVRSSHLCIWGRGWWVWCWVWMAGPPRWHRSGCPAGQPTSDRRCSEPWPCSSTGLQHTKTCMCLNVKNQHYLLSLSKPTCELQEYTENVLSSCVWTTKFCYIVHNTTNLYITNFILQYKVYF